MNDPVMQKIYPSLDTLGRKHDTDKAGDRHNYLRHYDDLLFPWRFQPINFLEIGIFNGGSLATWRDYFPFATIVGIDIDPTSVQYADDSRVHVRVGDQGDAGFLTRVAEEFGPFQVIIDDGSHHGHHQQVSLEALYPFLLPSGIYIVEDLHTSYFGWGDFMSYAKGRLEEVIWPGGKGYSHGHGDPRNHPEWNRIQQGMSDFSRQTKSVTFLSSLAVFTKWPREEQF